MLNLWDMLKEEKKKRMKKYKVRPFGHLKKGEKVKSQSVRSGVVLKNCVSESKQKRREK